MSKIHSLNLHETISRWINNYLSNRSQVVAVNGLESSAATVLSGVPQGSVLGPLLFLIYIDDLPSIVQNLFSKVNLFADDILLFHLISTLEDYATLQLAISLIEEWSVTNFLNFNAGKCKYMLVSRKQSPFFPPTPLRLFGCPMQRVDCCKYQLRNNVYKLYCVLCSYTNFTLCFSFFWVHLRLVYVLLCILCKIA